MIFELIRNLILPKNGAQLGLAFLQLHEDTVAWLKVADKEAHEVGAPVGLTDPRYC